MLYMFTEYNDIQNTVNKQGSYISVALNSWRTSIYHAAIDVLTFNVSTVNCTYEHHLSPLGTCIQCFNWWSIRDPET